MKQQNHQQQLDAASMYQNDQDQNDINNKLSKVAIKKSSTSGVGMNPKATAKQLAKQLASSELQQQLIAQQLMQQKLNGGDDGNIDISALAAAAAAMAHSNANQTAPNDDESETNDGEENQLYMDEDNLNANSTNDDNEMMMNHNGGASSSSLAGSSSSSTIGGSNSMSEQQKQQHQQFVIAAAAALMNQNQVNLNLAAVKQQQQNVSTVFPCFRYRILNQHEQNFLTSLILSFERLKIKKKFYPMVIYTVGIETCISWIY
jgi:hypothetical protein